MVDRVSPPHAAIAWSTAASSPLSLGAFGSDFEDMEKFPTPALSYVLFLFYGSQLAPWVVQQKKRLRREGGTAPKPSQGGSSVLTNGETNAEGCRIVPIYFARMGAAFVSGNT